VTFSSDIRKQLHFVNRGLLTDGLHRQANDEITEINYM